MLLNFFAKSGLPVKLQTTYLVLLVAAVLLGGSSCERKEGCPSKSLPHPLDPNLGVCSNIQQVAAEANKIHVLLKHCAAGKQTVLMSMRRKSHMC